MENTNLKKITKNEEGFTLTELLIVVAIIGMIATFVGQNVISKFGRAKVDGTKINMRNIGNALDDFKRECGFYPLTDQGLEALLTKPTGGRECKNYDPEGYIKGKKLPLDGWNNPFVYESDGNKYVLKSLGADGKEGGTGNDADISSEDL